MLVNRRFSRRGFLATGLAAFAFQDQTVRRILQIPKGNADPEQEGFWNEIRKEFQVDSSFSTFNYAGLSPAPKYVLEAQQIEERRTNSAPSYLAYRIQIREIEPIRKDIATLLGCSAEELALTNNATYGLQTGILGLDLPKGAEILTSSHDYPRTQTAIRQRERREGIVYVEAEMSAPPKSDDEVVSAVLAKVSSNTKLVVLCQISYLIGHVLPIRKIADALSAKGAPLFVDGAQAIGLMPEKIGDLGASLYTACLHKWMMAPVGTGVFFVKKELMKSVWPLHPADASLDLDARKFEQWGTHPLAPILAIRESLEFHQALGQPLIAARLEFLRQRLVKALIGRDGVEFCSSLDASVCRGMVTIKFAKAEAIALASWLWTKHKIHVTTAVRAGVSGIRISPHIFNTIEEMDRLAAVLLEVAEKGIA